MIRGTKNEGISSLTKQRHAGGFLTNTGTKGESYETVVTLATGVVSEVRDAFDSHVVELSDFPSNNFNGTYE